MRSVKRDALFRTVLDASLPQRAWGATAGRDKVAAAHRAGVGLRRSQGRGPLAAPAFICERALDRKLGCCSSAARNPDTGTLAVEQLLANEPKERAAAFAFAAYPAAVSGSCRSAPRG